MSILSIVVVAVFAFLVATTSVRGRVRGSSPLSGRQTWFLFGIIMAALTGLLFSCDYQQHRAILDALCGGILSPQERDKCEDEVIRTRREFGHSW